MNDFLTSAEKISFALFNQAQLWQARPFYDVEVSWASEFPILYADLLNLSDASFENLSAHFDELIAFLGGYIPQIDFRDLLLLEERLPGISVKEQFDYFDALDIAGRKWEQILAFAGCMPIEAKGIPVVDWCSGKGHLARVIERSLNTSVTCLEYDTALCEAGQRLAQKRNSAIIFREQDVRAELPKAVLQRNSHHMALHACGDLHIHLLQQASENHVPRITLSPCCYHKIENQRYTPLSTFMREQLECYLSSETLRRQDLQLATEETVTGGEREKRLRQIERLWRTAFDFIQREYRGVDEYLPVPSVKRAILSEGFDAFCKWARQKKYLDFEMPRDSSPYLKRAKKHLASVNRLELVRQPFRRLLEHWLVLDRVIALQERGYHVEYGTFCEKSLTPRNFLIQATLTDDD